MAGARPRFCLEADPEAEYLARAAAALESARLNLHYPDWRALRDYLLDLGHAAHGGLYPGVELHAETGLPTLKEWTRIRTDRQMAESSLAQLPALAELERRSRERPASVYGVQLLRRLYYQRLAGKPTPPLEGVQVKLRRVDAAARRAYLTVTVDRQHLSGLLVRHTVDLSESNGPWDRPHVAIQGDVAQHTTSFGALVYRHAALGAELLFMQLSSLAGVRVERVAQGTLGPFFTAGTELPEGLPHELTPLFSFGLELVGGDVAHDRDNDPLQGWLRDRLSEAGRAEYQAARTSHGYNVFRDRKFVTTAPSRAALEAWCTARGKRNIVYHAKEQP